MLPGQGETSDPEVFFDRGPDRGLEDKGRLTANVIFFRAFPKARAGEAKKTKKQQKNNVLGVQKTKKNKNNSFLAGHTTHPKKQKKTQKLLLWDAGGEARKNSKKTPGVWRCTGLPSLRYSRRSDVYYSTQPGTQRALGGALIHAT